MATRWPAALLRAASLRQRSEAGQKQTKGRRDAVRRADARRMAAAATAALAVDFLVIALLSFFLSELSRKAFQDERSLWISVEFGLVGAGPAAAGTELAESATVAMTTGTEHSSEMSALANQIVLSRTGSESAPISTSPSGTELALVGTELIGSAFENDIASHPSAGTELSTREDLLIRLDEEIARNLSYPPRARTRGIEGRVLLDLSVDEIGQLKDCSVEKSSGSPMLDNAAQRLIVGIFPLPARLDSPFSALVAVEYKLR